MSLGNLFTSKNKGEQLSSDHYGADPQVCTSIEVTIDQLRPYHNNPRKSRNPEFDSILASIETRGLDHPPDVTRCTPEDDFYTIVDGGNTRLEILEILYNKYNDLAQNAANEEMRLRHLEKAESFYRFNCTYKPWVGESHALAGHMCENEIRGKTLFIEKSLAVKTFREIFREEDMAAARSKGEDFLDKPLTQRALAERISAKGWHLSDGHISRFEYAANVLLDVIPRAMWAGAGEPKVKSIRAHEKAYSKFWSVTDIGRDNPDEIIRLFYETLAQHDDDEVDITVFCDALNSRLSDLVQISFSMIGTEINSILNGVMPGRIGTQSDTENTLDSKTFETVSIENSSAAETSQLVNTSTAAPPTSTTNQDENESNASTSTTDSTSFSTVEPDHNQPISTAPTVLTSEPELNQVESEEIINNLAQELAAPYDITLIKYKGRIQSRLFAVTGDIGEFDPDSEHTRAVIWWGLFRVSRTYNLVDDKELNNTFQKLYARYLNKMPYIQLVLKLEETLAELPDALFTKFQELQLRIRDFHALME